VVTADFNGDGWLDVYVANDGDPNFLWLNQRDGTLVNDALMAGVALNGMGSAEASMGVDAGDFDEDGDLDLFMTHIMEETNTLYQNDGKGLFEDRTIEIQLAVASLRRTAFGTAWVDFENDGWLDLIVLNGAVRVIEELARRGDPYPLHQPNQLFRNDGQGAFSEISTRGGTAFETSDVSRGVASGDIDNDGDMDLVVLNNQAPAQLLLNRAGNRNHWIGLRLLGSSINRDMLGTTVEVLAGQGQSRHRRSRTDGSYCSASDPRVLVGMGDAPSVSEVRVVWPDGEVNVWEGLSVNRYYTLRQGDSPNVEVGPGAGMEAVAETIIPGSSIPDDRARPDEILPAKRQRDPETAGRQISPLREGLLPLILPEIDSLEPVVRDQLRALEEQLRELGEKEVVTSRELALAYGQAGETYHAYELYSAAESCYVNAGQLDNGNFRWSYMRGLLYHAAGRLDETLAQYSQARAIRTDYSAVLVNMGDVYLQKNEVELAQRAFQLALDSGSNSPAARYGLGRVALRQQRYSKAAELLQSVLQSVPQANRIHHSLAMAYRGLGDMQRASEHFSRLGPIGLRPVDPLFDHLRELLRGERSHLLRGRKAFAASDFEAAAEEFGKAVRAAPSSVRARLNLAVALAKIGHESRAVQEFREVLKSDSANPTAHFNLGAIRAGSGDHQAAVQHFQEVVQMNPRDAEAHYLLGKSWKNLGRSAEALTGYRAAIESNPNHEDALLEEAGLLFTESRYGLAVQRLEEAYQRLPHQGRIAHSLARILAACPDRDLRNGSRALELALRVYAARPTVVHAETVALALAQLDRCDEAREWQEGAIRGLRNAGQVERTQELESMLETYRRGAPCRP
jgi:tetratricopeptide (TPR) repeat protein